ncbi:MAG: RsmD family RNA methyltransferase, partial [Bacteroidales bacterium]|nr:RsmD family RNA methyltransferase [Bacteroidales bacterium]
MRIISGTYKGRRFDLPRTLKARPTTDFAKEALFNILDNRLNYEELVVLDLFSGTGSIGLEFVSRGAITVTCVEQYAPHIKFIRKLIEKLGLDKLKLIQGDVYQYIHRH